MNRKVIYTCLVGNYDKLLDPLVIDESYDYICFSNDIPVDHIGVWEIKHIPIKLEDKIRLSRYVKLMPHEVLQNYDYSIWMDANIQITGSEFYEIIERKISSNNLVCQVEHCFPPCDCVYEEMKYAYSLGRSGLTETKIQYKHLKDSGFPTHWGLYENNILLRKHNDGLVRTISEEWWQEFNRYTRRDQFSLVYVYWKNQYRPELLFQRGSNSRNVPFLKWYNHVMNTPGILEKIRFQASKMIRLMKWNLAFIS